ncbi:MAG: thioredoxin-disulfide reductase [Candidatus Aenigmatarchaeota archaeon]
MENIWDVIIIGAGAAGLTASIYTCRRSLKTLVISLDIGGLTNLAENIENYPGYFPENSGANLMQKIYQQALKNGANFEFGEVERVEKENDFFKVILKNGNEFFSKSIIVASGSKPRKLNVPGEDKLIGKGVSYCVTCDAPLFKDKVVAVVGGGNSALEGALVLSSYASKIYLIHRREEFRAEEIIVDKVKKNSKIELVLNCVVTEIIGEKNVEKISVKNLKTNEERKLDVKGVFIEIGHEPSVDFIKHLVKTNERNEIIVDLDMKTSCEGIFAAGDITNIKYKQAIIAAGTGAIAALSAYDYLMRKIGKTGIRADWR